MCYCPNGSSACEGDNISGSDGIGVVDDNIGRRGGNIGHLETLHLVACGGYVNHNVVNFNPTHSNRRRHAGAESNMPCGAGIIGETHLDILPSIGCQYRVEDCHRRERQRVGWVGHHANLQAAWPIVVVNPEAKVQTGYSLHLR